MESSCQRHEKENFSKRGENETIAGGDGKHFGPRKDEKIDVFVFSSVPLKEKPLPRTVLKAKRTKLSEKIEKEKQDLSPNGEDKASAGGDGRNVCLRGKEKFNTNISDEEKILSRKVFNGTARMSNKDIKENLTNYKRTPPSANETDLNDRNVAELLPTSNDEVKPSDRLLGKPADNLSSSNVPRRRARHRSRAKNHCSPVVEPEDLGFDNSFELKSSLLTAALAAGYTSHTAVQKLVMSTIFKGRDITVCPPTTLGKPTAYLLPILNILLEEPPYPVGEENVAEPHCVFVAPSAELAQQIHSEALKLVVGSPIPDGHAIILVTTPGNLLKLLDLGQVSLASVRFLVIDDADKMALEPVLAPRMEKIMGHCTMIPKTERQTVFLSAKFPKLIRHFADEYTTKIHAWDVKQVVLKVTCDEKINKLAFILRRQGKKSTLVVAETSQKADWVATELRKFGLHPKSAIKGATQGGGAFQNFNAGKLLILVTSDVAFRREYIASVAHVINYDSPQDIGLYRRRMARIISTGCVFVTSFYDTTVPHFMRKYCDDDG